MEGERGRQNVERYREALEAWNRRDLVWILEQAAPDLEFNTAQIFPGIEPIYRGREGMVEFWTTFIEEPWALFRLEVDALDPAGEDRVLALITFHGTSRESGEEVAIPTPTWRPSAARRWRGSTPSPTGTRPGAPPDSAEPCSSTSRSRSRPPRSRRWSPSGSLLGFERVESPEALGGYVTWLERQGTQIHLIHTEDGTVPVLGHAAVVVDDFAGALERVAGAGHEVAETRAALGRAAGVRDRPRRAPRRADGVPAAGEGLTAMPSFETVRVAAIQATPVILDAEATIGEGVRPARRGGGRRRPARRPARDLHPALSRQRLGARRRLVRGLGRALGAAVARTRSTSPDRSPTGSRRAAASSASIARSASTSARTSARARSTTRCC